MKMKKSIFAVFSILMLLFLAACGGNGNNDNNSNGGEATNNGNENNSELSGTVVINGSGTVFPLMSRIAEEFMLNEAEGVSVEVGRAGTSAGMQMYVNGETDLANASRPVKEEELAQIEEAGFESKEFKVALDGLTIVIHPDNDWATEMTEEEIKTIFVSGAVNDDDVVLWSDIRPEWPKEEINFYGPNENHGTYEFFVDEIVEGQDLVSTIQLEQEYSTLVHLISEDVNGIAFFGYGYYASNNDKLKAVAVDFGNGPVEPSLETIAEDGPYANFTRPVFTNINIDAVREKPQVKAFAEYIFETGAEQFAGDTGFAPLPGSELEEALEFIRSVE